MRTERAVFLLFLAGLLLVLVVGGYQMIVEEKRWAARPRPAPKREADTLSSSLIELSTEPDAPQPLGAEIAWLAIRCEEPERVIAALDMPGQQANWATGLAAARQGDGLFVSPPVDGFVLVVFRDTLPEAGDLHLLPSEDWYDDEEWAVRVTAFDEVQSFDISDKEAYYGWEQVISGRLVRRQIRQGYRVCADEGAMTEGELLAARAGIARRRAGAPFTAEDVMDIAAAWGVDPRFERTYSPSVGWLCRLDGWEED